MSLVSPLLRGCSFIILMVLSTTATGQSNPQSPEETRLLLEERGGKQAYKRLRHLSDHLSPRINGSQQLEDALRWTKELMDRDGLSSIRMQPVKVPHWVRGQASAAITHPVKRPLDLLALGGSVSTPKEGIEGELIIFPSLSAMELTTRKQVQGKIVLINEALPPYDDKTGKHHYESVSPARTLGPATASKLGAKAALIRSITANSLGTLHTGMTRFDSPGAKPIPAASITLEDAERLVRLNEEGSVRIRLRLDAKWLEDAPSHNVIGEIGGTTHADEIILLAAHMDTWDVGDGSMDNGCGCMMALEAVRLLNRLPFKPSRTIRLVIFTDEEHFQRGAQAYFKEYGHENHVAAVETDLGCDKPRGFTVDGKKEDMDFLKQMLPGFAPLGVKQIDWGGSGANIAPLIENKDIPGIGIAPESKTYFDRHHSSADTFEKISPVFLDQHARALALLLHVLSERDLQ